MEAYEIKHREIVRSISPECMVLLKSDGSFPLERPGEIALYGNAARNTIKGGTGSGDVNVRSFVTVEQGLENAGFTITSKAWLKAYDAIRQEADKQFKLGLKEMMARDGLSAFMKCIGAIMQEPEYELPTDAGGDTAIYVLGRISGEGADRSVEKGNFLLTDTEIRDILALQKRYERFMLVLNVGGVVDLSPVVREVANILLLSQLGIAIGDALADALLGKVSPSGKLTTTWAPWADYCHVGDFGEHNDTRYKEGIYVGYRYFDSVSKNPVFPFGFGLSYTSFSIINTKVDVHDSLVRVTAEVMNIGHYPGKEVVQLYVTVPEGKLDQPYQVLAAFTKTKNLQPGETQEVRLMFMMQQLASFDSETKCDILEVGRYTLHIGNSSRSTRVCAVIELDKTTTVQKLHDVGGKPDFIDWRPEQKRIPTIPAQTPCIRMSAASIAEITPEIVELDPEARKLAASMTENDLALLCTGAYNGSTGSNSIIGNAGITVAGAAGETTGIFGNLGIPALIMADGPAGLRISPQYGEDENGVYSVGITLFEDLKDLVPLQLLTMLGLNKPKEERRGKVRDQYCTAIPIGTALAQSWSEDVCEICGDLVACEMERFGVQIWLAPAMNIHRFPLCGRNFEYYSEDPLISGKMAAAITRGVRRHHSCDVSVKHFCVNNQETNRMHNNSILSQRALRDIYLKGFRIVVEEAAPATIMSSYNLLNGEHTSQRGDLLETLLRQEWGYKGIVMSDWVTADLTKPEDKYPGAQAGGSIKAGNDLMMPGTPAHHENLMHALKNPEAAYPIAREQLEKCAARMIQLAWSLGKTIVLTK